MASGLKRDVDKLIKRLERTGKVDIGKTTRGHWKIMRQGYGQMIISPDPTDPHSIRNARADLKRYLSIVL